MILMSEKGSMRSYDAKWVWYRGWRIADMVPARNSVCLAVNRRGGIVGPCCEHTPWCLELFAFPDGIAFFGEGSGAFQLVFGRIELRDGRQTPAVEQRQRLLVVQVMHAFEYFLDGRID